jgi:hypothetical protein
LFGSPSHRLHLKSLHNPPNLRILKSQLSSASAKAAQSVNLLTGERSCDEVPSYEFKFGCRWNEFPGESLLFTGAKGPTTAEKDVVRLDVGTFGDDFFSFPVLSRAFTVSPEPPRHFARLEHAVITLIGTSR